MAELPSIESIYGPDVTGVLFMWRLMGVSFGARARFWWTAVAAVLVGALAAAGALLYKTIVHHVSERFWLTEELEEGLPYDGWATLPAHVPNAYAAWGSGEWWWLAVSVVGGVVIGALKFTSTALSQALESRLSGGHCGTIHSHAFPTLTPSLVVEFGCLEPRIVHGCFVLLCGAVSMGVGASTGPEAPNAAFGGAAAALVFAALSRLRAAAPASTRVPPFTASRHEIVYVGIAGVMGVVFPSVAVACALALELNLSTTILSAAAVEHAISVLRSPETKGAGPASLQVESFVNEKGASGAACAALPPHTKMRFDFGESTILCALAGGVGIFVYGYVADYTELSQEDVSDPTLHQRFGVGTAAAMVTLLARAWSVKQWHYPVAGLFGLLGALLSIAAEISDAIFVSAGIKISGAINHTPLNRWWTRVWATVLRQDEVLSLGQCALPAIGGVVVGLFNVLQPFCMGEGTEFIGLLFEGTNARTLTQGTLVGVGFLKILATRAALGLGFVGGKFFPTMFLCACVGCAIFQYANDASVTIIDPGASLPLLFPVTCLMSNGVVALAPLFISIPLTFCVIFNLDAEQVSSLSATHRRIAPLD